MSPSSGRAGSLTSRLRFATAGRELALVAVLYLVYTGSRLAAVTSPGAAERNGQRVFDLERALHLDIEHSLNSALYSGPRVLSVASSYYYESLHYILTTATLIWLFRRHAGAYRRARTWLAAMTFPALIAFWLFPVAPPRLVPGAVGHDTIAEQSRWGWWGSGGGTAPSGLGGLVNEHAAMPSLHVGWAVWVGVNVVRHARRRWVRVLGAVYPFTTALVVVATGNHYVLDVVAGAALAGLSLALVDTVARHRHRITTSIRGAAGRTVRPVAGALRRPRVRWSLAGVAVLAVVVGEVAFAGPYVSDAAPLLRAASHSWLVIAVGAEVVSVVCFIALQRMFVTATGSRVRMRTAASTVLAGNALSATLPGGSVISAAYVTRRMRRWGASPAAVSYCLLATGALCSVTLLAFGTLSVTARAPGPGVIWSLLQIAAWIGAVVALVAVSRRPQITRRLLGPAVAHGSRWATRAVDLFASTATMARPSRWVWVGGVGYATAKWLADMVCLYAALRAAGVDPDAGAIVVAYVAGAAATSLTPLIPAGLGVVDAAVIATLHGSGVAVDVATAATVLYRVITLGFLSGAGWLILAAGRRDRRTELAAAAARARATARQARLRERPNSQRTARITRNQSSGWTTSPSTAAMTTITTATTMSMSMPVGCPRPPSGYQFQ